MNCRKLIAFTMILALLLGIASARALAEGKTAQATLLKHFDDDDFNRWDICDQGGLFALHRNGYTMYNDRGEQVNATPYRDAEFVAGRHVVKVQDDNKKWGLIAQDGTVLIPLQYDSIHVLSDLWQEAKGNSVDFYCDGQLVYSMSLKEFNSDEAYGDFLTISTKDKKQITVERNGTVHEYDQYFYNKEFVEQSNGSVFHPGSGQNAFEPGCTLREDQVSSTVCLPGKKILMDLQGNLYQFNVTSNHFHDGINATSCVNGYLMIQDANTLKYGIYNTRAEEIIPCKYDEIADGTPRGRFNSGYLAVVRDGKVGYVDLEGNETGEFAFVFSGAVKGFDRNAPFLWISDLESGKVKIYSAIGKVLPTLYDDVDEFSAFPGSCVLCVKNNDLYGVIDLYGNEVIPCSYDKIGISSDGTLILAENNRFKSGNGQSKLDVFTVSYGAPQENPAAEADEQWKCSVCNSLNEGGKFCPMCGSPRP